MTFFWLPAEILELKSLVTLWFRGFFTVLKCNLLVFISLFRSLINIIIYVKIYRGCSKITENKEDLPSSVMPLGIMPFNFVVSLLVNFLRFFVAKLKYTVVK